MRKVTTIYCVYLLVGCLFSSFVFRSMNIEHCKFLAFYSSISEKKMLQFSELKMVSNLREGKNIIQDNVRENKTKYTGARGCCTSYILLPFKKNKSLLYTYIHKSTKYVKNICAFHIFPSCNFVILQSHIPQIIIGMLTEKCIKKKRLKYGIACEIYGQTHFDFTIVDHYYSEGK